MSAPTGRLSHYAFTLWERHSLAVKRATLNPSGKAESLELIAAANALEQYIADLEAVAPFPPPLGPGEVRT